VVKAAAQVFPAAA